MPLHTRLVSVPKQFWPNPSTYEIIDPSDFGMKRYVHFASRLTGWNAIKLRAQQLDIEMTDAQYKECMSLLTDHG